MSEWGSATGGSWVHVCPLELVQVRVPRPSRWAEPPFGVFRAVVVEVGVEAVFVGGPGIGGRVIGFPILSM